MDSTYEIGDEIVAFGLGVWLPLPVTDPKAFPFYVLKLPLCHDEPELN